MNADVSIVMYTHSEYSFLWKAAIPLLERYASKFQIHWCCDQLLDYTLPASWTLHIYDSKHNWSARIRDCVKHIPTEYIVYLQEDWLLIDTMDECKVQYLVNFMKDKNCEFIMAGIRQKIVSDPIPTPYESYILQRINGHWMQPALWKKTLLEKITQLDIPLNQYELGEAYEITKNALCYAIINTRFPEQSTRALYFPHMHSICGGKWTFLKYPTLKGFVESLGIDTTLRGVDTTWLIDKGIYYEIN
jgi:hypothetical protein